MKTLKQFLHENEHLMEMPRPISIKPTRDIRYHPHAPNVGRNDNKGTRYRNLHPSDHSYSGSNQEKTDRHEQTPYRRWEPTSETGKKAGWSKTIPGKKPAPKRDHNFWDKKQKPFNFKLQK